MMVLPFFRGFFLILVYDKVKAHHRGGGDHVREKELIQLLRQQDPRGLEALQLHYGPLMRYVIAPILSNPHDQEHWKVFHHFLWQVEPEYLGNESIHLWPAYRRDTGWRQEGGFSGQVLYDKDGQTLTAPYYYLGNETYTTDTIFWGEQTSTDVFAAYSMPHSGEQFRGYVSYEMLEVRDGYMVDGWANFTHQTGWFQYPVQSAMEYRKTAGIFATGPFQTVQTALQFRPVEDDTDTSD